MQFHVKHHPYVLLPVLETQILKIKQYYSNDMGTCSLILTMMLALRGALICYPYWMDLCHFSLLQFSEMHSSMTCLSHYALMRTTTSVALDFSTTTLGFQFFPSSGCYSLPLHWHWQCFSCCVISSDHLCYGAQYYFGNPFGEDRISSWG